MKNLWFQFQNNGTLGFSSHPDLGKNNSGSDSGSGNQTRFWSFLFAQPDLQ
jgi:hypothetical protein